MPTYTYRCPKCGKRFERAERIAEHGAVKPTCPKCGDKKVQPVMATFFAKTTKKS